MKDIPLYSFLKYLIFNTWIKARVIQFQFHVDQFLYSILIRNKFDPILISKIPYKLLFYFVHQFYISTTWSFPFFRDQLFPNFSSLILLPIKIFRKKPVFPFLLFLIFDSVPWSNSFYCIELRIFGIYIYASPIKLGKGTGRVRNCRTSRDHSNYPNLINSGVLTSLLLSHFSSSLTYSLPSLNLLCHSKTDALFRQDAPKAVWNIPYVFVAIFPSLKQNFIAYRSSKVSSHPDCIF